MLIAILAAAAASLGDPQIATIALTAHQIDVDLGYVGPGRAFTPLTSHPPEAKELSPMCPV